jgi:25S rRNA (adenine2142-N1)-methyltransferase
VPDDTWENPVASPLEMAIKKAKSKVLSSGRPPFSQKLRTGAVGSSRATRSVIRGHHARLKAHSQALANGDISSAQGIASQIASSGGLEAYQLASQTGQLSERGGDSSKLLVSWLNELGALINAEHGSLKVLEVGCLSPQNAISKCKATKMTRIDLRSTHPLIEEQDFMDRPIPTSEEEKFELLSLSLVLNFVPDAIGRGEMLSRTTSFLCSIINDETSPWPMLFLTLPLPCVTNSRYLTPKHLESIMQGFGYNSIRTKTTTKMYYSLWKLEQRVLSSKAVSKKEINPGKGRNNFCIVVQ